MLNIIGILLSFIGTVITLTEVLFKKGPDEKEMKIGELLAMKDSQRRNKKYVIYGMLLVAIGFFLQLISAIKAYYNC